MEVYCSDIVSPALKEFPYFVFCNSQAGAAPYRVEDTERFCSRTVQNLSGVIEREALAELKNRMK